jgi:probable F420-dependent oxidoreductase
MRAPVCAITTVLTDESLSAVELATRVEALGFESLWIPEHTHMSARLDSSWPGGGAPPRAYSRTLDPFVALAMMAVVTTRLRLATGVALLAQRDPIVTAKAVATLDHVSGGRFILGVGAGWSREEAGNHRVPAASRWTIVGEHVEAMRAIWSSEVATYTGTITRFRDVSAWPKPAAPIPIMIGGNGASALQRVVAFGDGWMPIFGRADAPERRIAELQELAALAGRSPIEVTAFMAPHDAREIERLHAAGVSRFVFSIPGPPEQARAVLERLGALAASVTAATSHYPPQ